MLIGIGTRLLNDLAAERGTTGQTELAGIAQKWAMYQANRPTS
jgi:hypothetical protein